MIDSISSGMMPMSPQQNRSTTSLTDDQRQLISDTLAQYDADNLTKAGAQSIVKIFNEAGIQPGKALTEAMAANGFNAREVGDTAGLRGRETGPPPAQGSNGGLNIDKESLEQLFTLLDQYLHDDMSDAERQSTLDSIRGTLIPEQGLFSDQA
jgi:hypothetical protein